MGSEMVDIRVRPEKCERCDSGQAFLLHVNPVGKRMWLCHDCVDALIDFGKKALNDRNAERSGNGG
jgi:hypothetical protein